MRRPSKNALHCSLRILMTNKEAVLEESAMTKQQLIIGYTNTTDIWNNMLRFETYCIRKSEQIKGRRGGETLIISNI